MAEQAGLAAEIPTQKNPKKNHLKKPTQDGFFWAFLDFKENRYILYLIPSFLYQISYLFSFKYIQRLIFTTILLNNKGFFIFLKKKILKIIFKKKGSFWSQN